MTNTDHERAFAAGREAGIREAADVARIYATPTRVRESILALIDNAPAHAGVTVQEAARVLLAQPCEVMAKAFNAIDRNQGEGADNIMAAALRALSEDRT